MGRGAQCPHKEKKRNLLKNRILTFPVVFFYIEIRVGLKFFVYDYLWKPSFASN